MSENFVKFKKKIFTEALIKSLGFSLSLGFITISLPLLYIKIKGLEFNTLYLILIGLGVTLITFGGLFLILKPTNKKVAKRLDKELDLKQKVQTMIEFQNEDTFMAKLQRENTLDILSKFSIKSIAMKFSVFFIVLLAVSTSLCITAFAVPNVKDLNPGPVGPVDPDYNLDSWTARAIKDLIDTVNESTIDQKLKTIYVSELENLLISLDLIDKESQMIGLVNTIISTLEFELDVVNTNNEIYNVLRTSDASTIVVLSTQIYLLNVETIETAIGSIAALINGSADAITELDDSFGQLLRFSNLDKNDPLYIELFELATNLNTCKDSDNIFESVRSVIETSTTEIMPIVKQQAENKEITDYVINGLKDIFGLNKKDEEGNQDSTGGDNTPGEGEDEEDDKNQGDLGGGLGSGDILFGSDEEFFDPELGKVSYGDVITDYYGDIVGKFKDGTISEEYKEFFDKYFEMLFGTMEDKE